MANVAVFQYASAGREAATGGSYYNIGGRVGGGAEQFGNPDGPSPQSKYLY